MCKHLSFLFLVAAVMFAALTFIASSSATAQTIVFVDATSTNTSPPSAGNPGDAWGNVAYKYLQNGLERARILSANGTNAVEVWVRGSANGLTYYPDEGHDALGNSLPNNDQSLTFRLSRNVKVYGGFNGAGDDELSDRNPLVNLTYLSRRHQCR